MAASTESRLCVVCKTEVKSTEIVFVCGLWCRKFFHNKCVGLSDIEARALTCKKKRIKFHCETCENRLGIELLGGKETHQPNKLDNCVNSNDNLLELVQNLLTLTNELSNDNSTINRKLDRVLTSNARLEEYILQSAKYFGKRNEETPDNSAEYVESDSAIRIADIREQNNDANYLHANSCASEGLNHQQQTDRLLYTAGDFPQQLINSQQQNGAEGCTSHEWAVPDGHSSLQDPLRICKEECSPPEDFPSPVTSSIEKREDLEDEVKAVFKDYGQELKHEVESTNIGTEPESTIPTGLEDEKINDDTSGLIPSITLAAATDNRIQCNMIEDTSQQNKFGTEHLGHRCNICEKYFPQLQDLNDHMCLDRHELLHSCFICLKTFKCRSKLSRHFRSHTDERPYSCGVCKKRFRHSSHLKEHSRLHTGERPFSCRVCNNTYTQSPHLIQHMREHTGERPYTCDVCHMSFIRSSTLKQHTHTHFSKHHYGL